MSKWLVCVALDVLTLVCKMMKKLLVIKLLLIMLGVMAGQANAMLYTTPADWPPLQNTHIVPQPPSSSAAPSGATFGLGIVGSNGVMAVPSTPLYQPIPSYQSPSQPALSAPSMPPLNPMMASVPNQPMVNDTTAQMVSVVVNAFLVRPYGNSEQLVPITAGMAVKPNDIVEYRAYYTNRTPDRIRQMTAVLEVPPAVELLGGIEPAIFYASVDGANYSLMPVGANVAGANYRALRWDISSIGIGGTAMVKYRARIR